MVQCITPIFGVRTLINSSSNCWLRCGLWSSGVNAADLNITTVSDYSGSDEQVTSITQFSDVYPTDWAYQALSNLVEQYAAGYPNGTSVATVP